MDCPQCGKSMGRYTTSGELTRFSRVLILSHSYFHCPHCVRCWVYLGIGDNTTGRSTDGGLNRATEERGQKVMSLRSSWLINYLFMAAILGFVVYYSVAPRFSQGGVRPP